MVGKCSYMAFLKVIEGIFWKTAWSCVCGPQSACSKKVTYSLKVFLKNENFIYQRTHIFSIGHACLRPNRNCLMKEWAKSQMHAYLATLWCNVAFEQDFQTMDPPQAKSTICFCRTHELRMVFTFFNDWKKIKRLFHDMWKLYENQTSVSMKKTFYWNKVMLFHLCIVNGHSLAPM